MKPLDRRRFLTRSVAALGAGGVGAAVGSMAAPDALASPAAKPASTGDALTPGLDVRVPFDGPHQAGILTTRPDQATFVALDSIAPTRGALIDALVALSGQARTLTQGDRFSVPRIDDPPPDSGILGDVNLPDSLTVTIAFGASLFDDRYGLSALRPRYLTAMPGFANDALDPLRSHGDVLVQICAQHRDTVVHTLRELTRTVRGALQQRWTMDGFTGANRGPSAKNSSRNLFAFRDGTANPDVTDAKLMNELIWVQPGAGEPAWAVDGTYMVARTIRMHVEFWDRVGLLEQEQMIGRDRVTGAPLGGTNEYQDPAYNLDPNGNRIPLNAHIRLANPRTDATASERILRRGYNYHRGIDEAGDLDQGLMFIAFNQNPPRQFATIQNRLTPEPMVDYITPVGGGYFFAPPGTRGASDWVGSGLA
jgi:deferrochelatase/peroxidase EfeB